MLFYIENNLLINEKVDRFADKVMNIERVYEKKTLYQYKMIRFMFQIHMKTGQNNMQYNNQTLTNTRYYMKNAQNSK